MSSLKVGIVGLPNVGKSTLFNALLKRQPSFAEATEGQAGFGGARVGNYPFTTIEPNVGVVEVPDERLERLADVVATSGESLRATPEESKRPPIRYATVEFVDIAGLVKGAAEGAGLGNKFLSHIREVDVIVQVLRDFTDPEVVKEGSVDPRSDYEVVTAELILKDLETITKMKESKALREKGMEKKKEIVQKLYEGLNSGKAAREILVGEDEWELAADMFLLTMKKEIKILNVGEDDPRLKMDRHAALAMTDEDAIYICAKIEAELSTLPEVDAKAYMEELGIKESGLDKLIKKAYETLGKISFLTAGEIEVRAWTLRRGDTALRASGEIHTDFMKKFIKARVVSYEDFVSYGGWRGVSDAGKVRLEGRDYVMADGDVVEFMIGS